MGPVLDILPNVILLNLRERWLVQFSPDNGQYFAGYMEAEATWGIMHWMIYMKGFCTNMPTYPYLVCFIPML